MGLYQSPLGLFPFQAEGVAICSFVRDNNLVVWSTGIGKSHLAMGTAAMLFEDNLIDRVIVCAEGNKAPDWVEDFERFTSMTVVEYRGTKAKREKIRADPPQVLVSTYETVRNDATVKIKEGRRRKPKYVPEGPLASMLLGQRVLVVYDEMPIKLGASRTSWNYIAHAGMLREIRKRARTRVLALTATPIERSPENIFNICRVIQPKSIGTVAQFEESYVKGRDEYGKPYGFKNITPDDCEPGVKSLRERVSPLILRKRKTDADVVDHFPRQVEEWEYITLDSAHQDFYDTVDTIDFGFTSEMEERQMFNVMRCIAGHPMGLLNSKGRIANEIVGQVGEVGLRNLGAAKLDALKADLEVVVTGQGEQAVVFTWFAGLILPWLHVALRDAGFDVAVGVDGITHSKGKDAERAFRQGQHEIFLASDASARGINLPNATYVFNYEAPLTHATYLQRIDRVHRIDSTKSIVHAKTYVALDTIEEAVISLGYQRNLWADKLLDYDVDDAEFITAQQRRKLREYAKKQAEFRGELPRGTLVAV